MNEKNLQQEIVKEIMVMDFEVKDVSIRKMINKIVAHTLARAELYFVNSETKDLANAISKLEIDVDKAKAQATAEILKEVEKFEKRLKPFDNDICPFTKSDVEFCEKNVSCLKCVLTKLKSKIQQTERFRTQSGAGGK